MTPGRIYFRRLKHIGLRRGLVVGLIVSVMTAGCSSKNHSTPVSKNHRVFRELITLSITSPEKPVYLYINEHVDYGATATCTDQFSDDGGATWHDIGPDTLSPPPIIVWSAAMGTFFNYGGNITTYEAPDESLVNYKVDDSVCASATTTGNDIYGVPATIEPVPTSPFDRDGIIDQLQQALSLNPDDPLNIQREFRIGNMLCFNPDLSHHEPAHPMKALAVFEGIMSRYDHKNYYDAEPPHVSDSPQLMVPRSAILAASILMTARPQPTTRPDEATKANQYLVRAMKDLQWTYDHRRETWATAPKPPPPKEELLGLQWDGGVGLWEYHQKLAASGKAMDLLGYDGIALITTAVRSYAFGVTIKPPNDAPARLQHLIEDFPNTLIAAEAKRQIDQAQTSPTLHQPAHPSDAK